MSKKGKNFLEYIPRHNVNYPYDVSDDKMVTIHVKWKGPFHKIASAIFKKPKVSHIELDRIGSCIWEEIDGKRTVEEICRNFEKKFPDEERHMDRLVKYLAILRNNSFIVYNVPEKTNKNNIK